MITIQASQMLYILFVLALTKKSLGDIANQQPSSKSLSSLEPSSKSKSVLTVDNLRTPGHRDYSDVAPSTVKRDDLAESVIHPEGNENLKMVDTGSDTNSNAVLTTLAETEDKALIDKVLSLMQVSKSNSEVITQAFRFVKLDAHLATLLSQLAQLRQSQESLQVESVKQQTKFNMILEEIRLLAANMAKGSLRLAEVEERLESEMEMMNDRIDSAIEKIIQSSVSTQILLDLSKDTIQQADKSVGISNEVLTELKSVRTELGDVGQASVQTIYNVQKLEESLLMALEETGNKTIYALRQDQQLQYQLLPLASAMRMDGDEASLVPLGNGSIGNSMMQADGTLLPESTSLPAVVSEGSPPRTSSTPSVTEVVADAAAKNDGRKVKAQQHTQDTTMMSSNPGKSKLQGAFSPSCSSSWERQISGRPRHCGEVQATGRGSSGIYRIYPFDLPHNGTEVYCDLLSDGGGWTVIQRRKEQLLIQQNFQKTWQEYASGFGNPLDSHWLGLDVISTLTETGDFQLLIELTDWEEETRLAKYAYFRVANATELYRLYVTDYSGNAGDSLAYHNGMAFTCRDRDNDLEKSANCAERYHGAWWYKSCHQSNLNGLYMKENNGKHDSYANGVNWYAWRGYYYSLKSTEMKIRSRHFESIK